MAKEECNDLPRCVCCFEFEFAGSEFQDAWNDLLASQDQDLIMATHNSDFEFRYTERRCGNREKPSCGALSEK